METINDIELIWPHNTDNSDSSWELKNSLCDQTSISWRQNASRFVNYKSDRLILGNSYTVGLYYIIYSKCLQDICPY